MFRIVILTVAGPLVGVWWSCKNWTIEEIQNIEKDLHLEGTNWLLEYK